ncbi:hypothetical protein HK097_011405 [Rhizophlyctis rosea]|uniref:Uncharacterized protein n=1 Tax=Rhizophlyctis rosea TaxID=64517 RepID=A0AAD5SEF5_9FUNG|nr:hypothetical protein HK097_011405 [Rhizophlyctis rosea]
MAIDPSIDRVDVSVEAVGADLVNNFRGGGSDTDPTGNLRMFVETIVRYTGRGSQVVKVLVEAGAESSLRSFLDAARHGHVDILKILIGAGGDAQMALREGCYSGSMDVVTRLLEAGADASASGWSCLNTAIHESHVEVVEALRDVGAPVETASLVLATNRVVQVCRLGKKYFPRLRIGMDCHCQLSGDQALHCPQKDMVEFLLSVGNRTGINEALRVAAENGFRDIVKMLMVAGADIHADGGAVLQALQALQ